MIKVQIQYGIFVRVSRVDPPVANAAAEAVAIMIRYVISYRFEKTTRYFP